MCFLCDGGTLEELHQLIDEAIDGIGWFVSAVEPEGATPSWAYTIGLLERFGHPELVVVRPHCLPCGGSLLNLLGDEVRRGTTFRVGDEVRAGNGRVVARIGPVHPDEWRTDRFAGWFDYYGSTSWRPSAPSALQVVWQVPGRGFQDDPWNDRWATDGLGTRPAERPRTLGPPPLNRRQRRARSRPRHRR